MRRRQRRLRAQLRHEQQSVAMAVAAALHHSANKKLLLGWRRRTAPDRARRLLLGRDPAPLAEVAEPQGLSVAPRCPDAGVPLLSVPLLAGRDGIDDTTVPWLLKVELRKRQKEEKEKKEEEERAETRRHAASRGSRSLSSKEEEEDSKNLFLSWPRSSSTLVTFHFTLCSLRLSSGLWCSAYGRYGPELQRRAHCRFWQ